MRKFKVSYRVLAQIEHTFKVPNNVEDEEEYLKELINDNYEKYIPKEIIQWDDECLKIQEIK